MITITNYTNYIYVNLQGLQNAPGILVETYCLNKNAIVRYGIKEGGVYIDMSDGRRTFIPPQYLDPSLGVTTAQELENLLSEMLGNTQNS